MSTTIKIQGCTPQCSNTRARSFAEEAKARGLHTPRPSGQSHARRLSTPRRSERTPVILNHIKHRQQGGEVGIVKGAQQQQQHGCKDSQRQGSKWERWCRSEAVSSAKKMPQAANMGAVVEPGVGKFKHASSQQVAALRAGSSREGQTRSRAGGPATINPASSQQRSRVHTTCAGQVPAAVPWHWRYLSSGAPAPCRVSASRQGAP
eukprot:CAMPEP_0168493930 /NCGR_PEP_ID=MMETSP0228-20121227/70971_1 /TAXON_ID=133427 /ORGANISM="Protoceratium reticulatum, Strain CCCM 535 (=CCMP 1889)" /LENGTH=205 /DNA_ID=CAMNT_0008510725 /DNA_START=32 /DNA_END=647 /DNA_ORIENTATION=-